MKSTKSITQEILNILNEGYVFPQNVKEEEDFEASVNSDIKVPSEEPIDTVGVEDDEFSVPEQDGGKTDEFSSKIKDMRKSAMIALAELDPEVDTEKCKLMKNIYEACDKFLYGKSEQKIQNNKQ